MSELLPYKNDIDQKYQFLLQAPVKDSEGRNTVVRYSRKTKEQYVRSEMDGKPTGWSAFYVNGSWSIVKKSDG